jgi:hypothetical protein
MSNPAVRMVLYYMNLLIFTRFSYAQKSFHVGIHAWDMFIPPTLIFTLTKILYHSSEASLAML